MVTTFICLCIKKKKTFNKNSDKKCCAILINIMRITKQFFFPNILYEVTYLVRMFQVSI